VSLPLLHVVRSLNPADGGPAELVRQLCAAHEALGRPAEVVTLDPPGASWLADFPAQTHALHGRGGYGWTPQLKPWLRSREGAFAGVFLHGLWQWQGAGVCAALRQSRIPYFVFPHGMLDPWFREASAFKHQQKSLYWRLVESRVMRDAAAVVFTCEEERRLGRGTFRPWAPRKEAIVTLGTKAPPMPAEELREKFYARFPDLRGERLLLFLGRLHPKKGCDLLIEAFRRVAPPMRLVVAGPVSDERFASRLREMASGLAVTFTGPVYGDEKWGALAAAEAFALVSHQENFGVAVAEALASGLPVLLSEKVNIWREIIADGAGFAEPDTLDGAVRLLERWMDADREAMRGAARNSFSTRFDIRRTAENLVALTTSCR